MNFDPVPLLARLVAAGVDFVVIGGVAGSAHGSAYVTTDLDVAYRRHPENLERLVSVLRDVNATLRGAPPDVPFLLDAKTLAAGDTFTFDTDFGAFDIFGHPKGAPSYEDLRAAAAKIGLGEIDVLFASLDHLIRMKEAAGRPRDTLMASEYRALSDEIRASRR